MSSILDSIGRVIFRLGYEISPVVLTQGVANFIPGGMLPLVAITEAANFITGLLSGGKVFDLDNFFAHFVPLPGASLINMQYGKYPFANQTVAANAGIVQPLTVSLRMICPVKQQGGYTAKLATMMALKAILDKHISLGGTFTVVTSSRFYLGCVLVGLKDITSGESHQSQISWQWDFEQLLITLPDALGAQNSLMSKLSNGLPTDGSTSGIASTTGSTLSGATPSIVPAATNLPAVAPYPTPTVGPS